MKTGGWFERGEELVARGYWIVDIPQGGKSPTRGGWTRLRVTPLDVEAINAMAYDPGVGLLTGVPAERSEWSVLAVDIDVTEPELVAALRGWCHEHIGRAPARVGKPPKALLIYRFRGERKKSRSATAVAGRIEYLGTGQQCVAYGIHPGTQRPYTWDVDELPAVDELSEITEAGITGLNDYFNSLCPNTADTAADTNTLKPERTKNTDLIKAIIDGSILHDNLLNLSYQLVRDGMPVPQVTQHLKGIMESSKARTTRPDEWLSRYTDLPRIVSGAVEKIKMEGQVSVPQLQKDIFYREVIPWPPGLIGRLTQDAYDMAMYRYREVALVSSLALVAGIAGRCFNVSGTGLNVYLTLVMGTGMGKESISEFIVGTLMQLGEMNCNTASFIGSSRYTGPRSLLNELKDSRCQVSILTEAGLLLKSSAGDQAGLSRVMLSLYSKSGYMAYSGRESFSKADESLPMLRSPCLTLVHEATPETLLEAFKDQGSLEKGEIPRQSIFRISGDKPYPNFDTKIKPDQECINKLSYLVKRCEQYQAMDEFKCRNMTPGDDRVKIDMTEFAHYCVDMENKHREPSRLKQIMHSRAYLKALKFAGIASVFNHQEPLIFREEWEWAKNLVIYEMNGIDHFFMGGGFGNPLHEVARRVAYPVIVKMLHGVYDTGKMTKQERAQGLFSGRAFRQILANNSELNKMGSDVRIANNPISGQTKLLNFLVETGYIELVEEKRALMYRITESFNTLSPAVCGGERGVPASG